MMIENEKRLVVDVDGTLTIDVPNVPYGEKPVHTEMVTKLRRWKEGGWRIVLFTSRNMRTYQGDINLINRNTKPVLLEWLNKHAVPYDEVIMGKPWCGREGFYIDDKALRPAEFLLMEER